MTSLQIAEFKKTLRHYIDTTDLPQEVKRYVLKDLLEEQEKLVFEELKKEVMEREQEESKNEESI